MFGDFFFPPVFLVPEFAGFLVYQYKREKMEDTVNFCDVDRFLVLGLFVFFF